MVWKIKKKKKKNFSTSGRFCLTHGSAGVRLHFWEAPRWSRRVHMYVSNFQALKFFSSHFSQELWGLEDWNLVHTWPMGRCIVHTGIRLLLLICAFTSSFFFLSNFQTLKFFVTLFSGTVRPGRLKLCTHMDSGQMYRVYWNQTAAAYLSLYFSSFFSPVFKH